MKDFWNDRYDREEFIYGTGPNAFLKAELSKLEPGSILFPAEGEGRNAVFAGQVGWSVQAFDISDVGRSKALRLAERNGVSINYGLGGLDEQTYGPASFDVIALIFAHLPPPFKDQHYPQFPALLKPGGRIILEVFSKRHPSYQARYPQIGGPGHPDLLFSMEEIKRYFGALRFELLAETEVKLSEGRFHVGTGSVIRCVAIND